MKTICLYILLTLIFGNQYLAGQNTAVADRKGEIRISAADQGIQFSAITPPLSQIAGAPPAFYSYLWEFGDGQFSFEENPVHVYPHEGEFEARLWLTNNYDDGKPPPTRPKKVYVKKSMLAFLNSSPDYRHVVAAERSLKLQTNHDPSPDEELVCIFSYKNRDTRPANGHLYLFYNERKFKQTHFEFGDARTYHGEKRGEDREYLGVWEKKQDHPPELWASAESGISAVSLSEPVWVQSVEKIDPLTVLDEARATYRDEVVWRFDNFDLGEERHIFTTLLTTKEMLKDTNAIISMQGIYLPDGGSAPEIFTLEMEVVKSHDPNHIAVSDTRVNFRRAKRNELGYKVQFQNIGEGPASEIRIETAIPEGLDPQTLELGEYYPYCRICPEEPVSYSCLDTLIEENKITFFFHNIYLPGIKQKGVFSRDSTKGYIKFKLEPEKDIKRIALNSRANIFFDNNPPIRTNAATTHFIGLAPGFKAGVDLAAADFSVNGYFVGLTLSPVKASKWYYQGEIMLGIGQKEDRMAACLETDVTNPEIPSNTLFISQESNFTEKTLFIEVVPLQFRKNLLDLISVGAGAQLSFFLNRKRETETITHPEYFQDPECQLPIFPIVPPPSPLAVTENLPNEGTLNLFADLNAGMVKNGPVAGLRYLYSLNPNFSNRFQFYMNWKF